MQENFNLVLKHLRFEPKIIVVDEVDYLVGNKNAIEVLRDIQDNTGVPIMNIVEPIRNKRDLKKIEKILKQQGLRDLVFFVIGTNCGLRISDILNLNVGDVKNKS